jgi:hypothetical protein
VRPGLVAAADLAATLASGATENCAICDKEVVLTSPLASCFLERYSVLQSQNRPVVVVDLTDCRAAGEKDRGVVEALTMPDRARVEPSSKFMISRRQLSCLKRQLEADGIVLDPAARIALNDCE